MTLQAATDLRTLVDGVAFAVRAGVLCQRGTRLLVEAGDSPFFNLPGGAVALGETLQEAAAREWREETGLPSPALRLVGLIENFFELRGQSCHELGFYYQHCGGPLPPELSAVADQAANHLTWVNPADNAKPIYPRPALELLAVPAGQFRHHICHDHRLTPGRDLRLMLDQTEVQVRVHLLYVQDGQVLTNTVPGSGFWFLPGGSVALGEDSVAATHREFEEETGIVARSVQLVGLSEGFHRSAQRQQLGLCYRVQTAWRLPAGRRPVQDHPELQLDWVPLDEVAALGVEPRELSQLLKMPPGQVGHLRREW